MDQDFGVKISADASQFVGELADAAAVTGALTTAFTALGKVFGEALRDIVVDFALAKAGLEILGDSLGVVTAAFVLLEARNKVLNDTLGTTFTEFSNASREGTKLALTFDAARAAAATLTNESQQLADSTQRISKELNYSVSSVDLLKASYNVLSDGFDKASESSTILKAAAIAAQGGFSDLGTASEAVTGILNSYNLSADKAARITDIMVATQNAGRITVDQYAKEIGQVSSIAAQAGVSIEELSAFIATSTQSGLRASESITGLRQAIANTLKPSSDAIDLADRLGIQFDATALQTKGLAGILAELRAKGQDSQEMLLQLFGSVEAVAAISPSAGEGARKFAENLNYITSSAGLASEAAKKVAESFDAEVKKAVIQGQELMLKFGQGIQVIVKPLVQSVNSFLSALNNLPPGVVQALGTLATAFSAIAAAVAAAIPVLIAYFVITRGWELIQAGANAAMVAFAGFIQNSAAKLVVMQMQMQGVNLGATALNGTLGLQGLKLVAADVAISGYNAAMGFGSITMGAFGTAIKVAFGAVVQFVNFALLAFAKLAAQLVLVYIAADVLITNFNGIKNILIGDENTRVIKELDTELNKLLTSTKKVTEEVNPLQKVWESYFETLSKQNSLTDQIALTFNGLINAIAGLDGTFTKYGADLGLITFTQLDAQRSAIAYAETATKINDLFQRGIGVLAKYGAANLTNAEIGKLSKDEIQKRTTAIKDEIATIDKVIEALRNKKPADEEQRKQNELNIASFATVNTKLKESLDIYVKGGREVSQALTDSLGDIKNKYETSTKQIEGILSANTAKIKNDQLAGAISAREAQDLIFQAESDGLRRRIVQAEQNIPILRAKLKGLDPEKDISAIIKINELVAQLEADGQKARTEIADKGLTERTRKEQQAYKDIEEIQKSALSAAALADKQHQISTQELLNQGVIKKIDAEGRNLQATQNRINKEIEAAKFGLQALEALPQSNDPEKEKERIAKIADARSKLTDLTLGLLKTQQQAEENLRAQVIKGLEEQGKIAQLEAQKRITANLAVLNSLKGELDLLTARNSLEEAQANLAKTRVDISVKIASALGDEATAQSLKLDGMAQENAAQERIFTAQQKSLDLTQQIKTAELERQKILDNIAIAESQIALAKLKALKETTKEELDLAQQVIDLNRQKAEETDKAIARQGEINGLKEEELLTQQENTRLSRQGQQAEEVLKQIREGNLGVADQMVSKLGLVGQATTNTAQATQAWSAELTRADGSMASVGNSAQNAANQTGQIYLELQKSTGEVQVFGGAMDGAVINIGNVLGEVGLLNLGLGETVNLGGSIGNAFANVATTVGTVTAAFKEAIAEAVKLRAESDRQQAQGKAARVDRDLKQGSANQLAQGLPDFEKELFLLQAEKKRLSGEIGGGVGLKVSVGGQVVDLEKAMQIYRDAIASGGESLKQLNRQAFTGSVATDDQTALEIARANASGSVRAKGGSSVLDNNISVLSNNISILNNTISSLGGFATGGIVQGSGTGTSDSIFAKLSNGEYVVNAQATAKNKPMLDAINLGGKLPEFATGGVVSISSSTTKKGGGVIQSYSQPGSNQLQAPSIQATQESFAKLNQSIGEFTGGSLKSVKESYTGLNRTGTELGKSLGDLSSGARISTRTISQTIPKVPTIRASNLDIPKISSTKAPGAIAAQAIGASNTINIVNRPEPEVDLRNALVQLGRAR